ncbi:hypothetical protein FE784_34075 [Paenibacillus hemerocallicola]|uniref:Uncharacterized protein n=2 Tax=Paenibacillus hemerocallicola TaxID=1172614 RepID=A0A5C4T0W2_9BACL|nr:hypothetical protein FE784_34075 [Paenibacillus hemerocallicola]
MAYLSLALFIVTSVTLVYSFLFPFEAGHPLQGSWFFLIMITSPIGLLLALTGLPKEPKKAPMVVVWASIGHGLLMLFLVLYMTLGYLIFGV